MVGKAWVVCGKAGEIHRRGRSNRALLEIERIWIFTLSVKRRSYLEVLSREWANLISMLRRLLWLLWEYIGSELRPGDQLGACWIGGKRKEVVSGLGVGSGGGRKGQMYIESREVAVWKKSRKLYRTIHFFLMSK